MFSKLPSAIMRAMLVVLLVSLPSLVLAAPNADSIMIISLIAICAAFFTMLEYTSQSPSIIEFRSAPPFNRIRFGALLFSILILSVMMRDSQDGSNLGRFFYLIGERVGDSIDVPFSPVRLLVLMMPEGTDVKVLANLRTAGGISYLISLTSLALFILMIRMRRWPRRNESFNVWVNLPRFDPTTGGDVVDRLNRDAQVNMILGFLLPFVIPAIVKLVVNLGGTVNLTDPQTLVWMVTAWAFLPASMLMRGVALSRVAQLIYKQRKAAYQKAADEGMLPV